MSGILNEIEPTLFRGNIALHSGGTPLVDGDGSLELEGTLYTDKIAPYNTGGSVSIFDTSHTPGALSCIGLSASGVVAFTNPLVVGSGGLGLSTMPVGRIMLGNGSSPVASSPSFVYSSSTLYCPNQILSGNLSVSGSVTLQSPLSVSCGGTGNSTFTTGNVLYGNGIGAVSQSDSFKWNNSTQTLSVVNVVINTNAVVSGTLTAGNTSISSISVSNSASFTSPITIGEATGLTHAATKGYVDDLIAGSGGVISAGTGLTKTGSVLSVNTNQSQVVSVGTLSGLNVSGVFTHTNTTQLTNTSNTITGSQGAFNISGDIHLVNGSSNTIYFRNAGSAAPTFTNRSIGTKLVICPTISPSATDYAIGLESSNLWFSTSTSATGFRWYGGTNVALTLSGTGVLTLSNSLCLPAALTSTRRNNTSVGWYILGLIDATTTTDGTRVSLKINGSSNYSVSFGGETIVNLSINNNTNASAANLDGTFYSFGDTPSITALKFVQNGGNRYSYYIYASMAANPCMSTRATGPTGFIWTEMFTSVTDPGADSATVKAATNMLYVNSPASFLTTLRASTFLTGGGWMQGYAYGIGLVGGYRTDSFLSLKASSVAFSSPELFMTLNYTALKRNDATTNSLYIDNVTGIVTVDYGLNVTSGLSAASGTFTSTTGSSSTSSGALTVAGGLGVGENLRVADTIYGLNLYLSGWSGVQMLTCYGPMNVSNGSNSVGIVAAPVTTDYTLTLPPAAPSTNANLMFVNTAGVASFTLPALATIFSTVNAINNCKIWTGTASVASGAITVFPTSTNIATGVAVFSTAILYASATATVNTTSMSSVALTGLRSISADRRTIIFNVVLPTGTAASNTTSVSVFIIGY